MKDTTTRISTLSKICYMSIVIVIMAILLAVGLNTPVFGGHDAPISRFTSGSMQAGSVLAGSMLATSARTEPDTSGDKRIILFFGDSITAGYGLDPESAFPALIRERADTLGWPVEVVNAGVSGETSAGGLRRVDWILRRPFDIFVLELGGNDGLRGIDPEHTRDNLQQIIDQVRSERPDVHIVLTGMEAPPNMGENYIREFRQVYHTLAASNDVTFMPFILEDVAGDPELNQADGIHPTAEGHRIIAENVWQVVEPLLKP